jgi:hypothetical protein
LGVADHRGHELLDGNVPTEECIAGMIYEGETAPPDEAQDAVLPFEQRVAGCEWHVSPVSRPAG